MDPRLRTYMRILMIAYYSCGSQVLDIVRHLLFQKQHCVWDTVPILRWKNEEDLICCDQYKNYSIPLANSAFWCAIMPVSLLVIETDPIYKICCCWNTGYWRNSEAEQLQIKNENGRWNLFSDKLADRFDVILTLHRRQYVEIKCQLDAT